MNYIRPDTITTVPIINGELRLSVAFDTIHSFPRLGANILKYADCENGRICNVMVQQDGADFLRDKCGLYVVERDFIYASEHEAWLGYAAGKLSDKDLEL